MTPLQMQVISIALTLLYEEANLSNPVPAYDDDPIAFLEFVSALEDHFDVSIGDDEAESWQTLGDACAYLESVGVKA